MEDIIEIMTISSLLHLGQRQKSSPLVKLTNSLIASYGFIRRVVTLRAFQARFLLSKYWIIQKLSPIYLRPTT